MLGLWQGALTPEAFSSLTIALNRNDLQAAARYLAKAGSSPQALNARGVLAVRQGDRQAAERFWRQSALPEAKHNLNELEKSNF